MMLAAAYRCTGPTYRTSCAVCSDPCQSLAASSTQARLYADPEKAARRIVEIASTVEPVQDGRIYVEKINGPFRFKDKGSPAEYGAGMKLALDVQRAFL
jgi:hypothetical protein